MVYMKIYTTHLKFKKCLTYMTLTEFWKVNATCNISPETTRVNNLDDFERDETDL